MSKRISNRLAAALITAVWAAGLLATGPAAAVTRVVDVGDEAAGPPTLADVLTSELLPDGQAQAFPGEQFRFLPEDNAFAPPTPPPLAPLGRGAPAFGLDGFAASADQAQPQQDRGRLTFDQLILAARRMALSEPGEWLLLTGGLGASGYMLRRARQLAADGRRNIACAGEPAALGKPR